MKQFINIYIISFVLILSQLSLFSSCKDEDTVAELKLDRTAIQDDFAVFHSLNVYQIFTILGGSITFFRKRKLVSTASAFNL